MSESSWHKPSPLRQALGLAAFVAGCFAAAAVGGGVTSTSVTTWYPTLAKPSWTPPDAVFGPVWTVLYLLMGVAAWLVWRRAGWHAAQVPLGLFVLQLILNVGWSVVFFGLRWPGLAFGELLLLWLAIAATMVTFWTRSIMAALLLAPYLAWSTFAAALNFCIWRMNS